MGRIAIIGAGSIGCHVGARLAAAGAAVTLVGRPRVLDEIRTHGLGWSDLRGGGGRVAATAVTLSEDMAAAATARLVLVTVKSADTAAAAASLAPVLAPSAVVWSLQNGLRNMPALRAALPGRPVLAGMVPFNVVPRGGGLFHQATQGALDGEQHPALEPWRAPFAQAGLPVALHADMPAVQWAKLLLNLNNAINALSGLPLLEQLSQRDWRRCMALAQSEALGLLLQAGQPLARLTPLPPRWLPGLLRLPDGLFLRLAQRMLAMDPLARSSMSEDLARGRASEVDDLNGEVVRLALRLNRHAPVNRTLVRLMREAEAGGQRHWRAEALLATLQAAAQG
ncbi:MAG: 2-dehydropantoate 2-reductase [Aquabacterium sp.]